MGFKKFSSIESFAHVYRGQEYFDNRAKVKYGAKIKLHGTNAAVRIDTFSGDVTAQSRSRDITPADDNAGFAAWVAENEKAWRNTFFYSEDVISFSTGSVIFFGEWAGPGIQKTDAVTKLNQKYFFVFAIYDEDTDRYVVDPDEIEKCIPDLDDVVVLPWDHIWETPIDFANNSQCADFAASLDAAVGRVGERDPFIYDMFGVDGPGEGWVLSPVVDPFDADHLKMVTAHSYNHFTFKVKTEAHKVKQGKSASKEIEVPDGVPEFVEMFVTPARCEQGLEEIGGDAIPQKTGDFMKWIGQDIKKESVLELADAGLEWKDVTKHVNLAARDWWLNKCKEI